MKLDQDLVTYELADLRLKAAYRVSEIMHSRMPGADKVSAAIEQIKLAVRAFRGNDKFRHALMGSTAEKVKLAKEEAEKRRAEALERKHRVIFSDDRSELSLDFYKAKHEASADDQIITAVFVAANTISLRREAIVMTSFAMDICDVTYAQTSYFVPEYEIMKSAYNVIYDAAFNNMHYAWMSLLMFGGLCSDKEIGRRVVLDAVKYHTNDGIDPSKYTTIGVMQWLRTGLEPPSSHSSKESDDFKAAIQRAVNNLKDQG